MRVHSGDEFPPGLDQRAVEPVRDAPGRVFNDPHARIDRREALEYGSGAIARRSRGEDELDLFAVTPVLATGEALGEHRWHHALQCLALVEDGREHAYHHIGVRPS